VLQRDEPSNFGIGMGGRVARFLTLAVMAGCGRTVIRESSAPSPVPAVRAVEAATPEAPRRVTGPASTGEGACSGCVSSSFSRAESTALERRIDELKAKGGACATYAVVLERAYRSGQITIRPYMWRVGTQLASGEAHANGAIFLAREIDSLNVGMRSFDELVWSMEHEAAHLAFNLDSPLDRGPGDRADAYVKACRTR
jgi:hypothetical protein